MRGTSLFRNLKRRALPILTSAAMAISMLSGTGVTAMAANIGDKIVFYKTDGTTLIRTDEVSIENDNKLLPDYADIINDATPGHTLKWVDENHTNIYYIPTKDTYGNVVTYTIADNPDYTGARLKAVITNDPISITYDLAVGHYVSSSPVAPPYKEFSVNFENPLTAPVKDGYDFAGWDITGNGKADINKDADADTQSGQIDSKCKWNGHNGSAKLTALWTENNRTLFDETTKVDSLIKDAQDKIAASSSAADEAQKAAEAADKAAKAANDNPTADTAAAARKAAEDANTAADNATKALSEANSAYSAAIQANKVLQDNLKAAEDNGLNPALQLATALDELNDELRLTEKARDEAEEKVTTQAAAATKAAENALAAASNATKYDGSEPGKPAAVGSKLKDANGDYTGYAVTKSDPSNPKVEYVGTDADRKAKKVNISEKVKDSSGNEYKVTAIADSALEKSSVKEITIPKTVKKIGKKAFYKSKAKKITFKTSKKAKIKIGDKAFWTKSESLKVKVKGAKGKYNDKIVNNIRKNAKKSADVQ